MPSITFVGGGGGVRFHSIRSWACAFVAASVVAAGARAAPKLALDLPTGRRTPAFLADSTRRASAVEVLWETLGGIQRLAIDPPRDRLQQDAAVFVGGRKGAGALTLHGFGGPPFAWSTALDSACFGTESCRAASVFDVLSRRRGLEWTSGGGPLVRVVDTQSAALGKTARLFLECGAEGTFVGYLSRLGDDAPVLTAGALGLVTLGADLDDGPSVRLSVAALVYRVPVLGSERELFVGAALGLPEGGRP